MVTSAVLFAQGTTSRVVGVVQDASGSSLPGATVRLKNEGTETAFVTTVGSGGTYSFESVQVGRYSVEVTAPGFKKFTAAGNIVNIGQPTTVNVTMQVGDVTESLEVTGSAEVVQTSTSGNIGNVIEEKPIKDLPIVGTRGRDPLQLIDLQPGVVDTQSITGGAVHVFGARDRAWNYTLDGIDSNESSSGGS